jgi:hypothetical protein
MSKLDVEKQKRYRKKVLLAQKNIFNVGERIKTLMEPDDQKGQESDLLF